MSLPVLRLAAAATPLLLAATALPAVSALGLPGLPAGGIQPSTFAAQTIPEPLLELYRTAAGLCRPLPWTLPAAMAEVSTGHGVRPADPDPDDDVDLVGIVGIRQNIWQAHAVDGNNDGATSPEDPTDAVATAVVALCERGAAEPARLLPALADLRDEAWATQVAGTARAYTATVAALGPAPAAGSPTERVQAVLEHPAITLWGYTRPDLRTGIADDRVAAILLAIANRVPVTASVIRTGHAKYVRGTTRISNHWCGQAVDLPRIAGQPVSDANPTARAVAEWVLSWPVGHPLRPHELGHPFQDLVGPPGSFSDRDHQGHLHLGWGPCAR